MKFTIGRRDTPQDVLSHALKKLGKKASDKKKLDYLEKHITQIQNALEQVTEDVPQPKSKHKTPESTEAKEKPLIQLNWYTALVSAIIGNSNVTKPLPPSSALDYFIEKTKPNAQQASKALFAPNPVAAFKTALHTGIFQKEIIAAMQALIDAEEPHLFIECHDALNAHYPSKKDKETDDNAHIFLSLAYMSEMALGQMLDENPNAVLFPRAQKKTNPDAVNYLSYLPEQRHFERFVMYNIDKIDMAVRAVAKDANGELISDMNDLCAADLKGEYALRLAALKTLMQPQQVKMCFCLAAGKDKTQLKEALLNLGGHATDLVKIYPLQSGKKDKPSYEILHLTNPSDNGDPKELWALRKPKKVLVVAFSDAALLKNLKCYAQGLNIKDIKAALSSTTSAGINLPEVA